MTDPKPTRRRFQFSLRTLLVVVTVCAVACSWLGVKLKQAQREREAAAAIVESLGMVKWSESSGPVWLRDLLGNGFFEHVEYVGFFGPFGKLENLKALTHLKSFHTASSPTTDADLPCLTELPLEELSLCGSNLSDVGLVHLEHFWRLRELNVQYTEVTDEGVAKLQQALPDCTIIH